MKKFISLIIAAVFIFAGLPRLNVSADNINWKVYLKNFLTESFPSLFDEKTIKKNEQLFKLWGENNKYTPNPEDIPVDALEKWDGENYYYPLLLPYEYKFYDLDGDNIPEVFIFYPTPFAEGHTEYIYKLYGASYEKIDVSGAYMVWREFYRNSQNKLVEIKWEDAGRENSLVGKQFADINATEKQFVYSDCTDDFSTLILIPEFDCSDIMDSIKYNTQLNPDTGENHAALMLMFAAAGISACLGICKIIKLNRRKI